MFRSETLAYPRAIQRPNVLLAVSHPRVGEGLEVLLRLEGRYDVRRSARVGEAVALARSWPAALVVIDGSMLPADGVLALGVPALVLAANDEDGAARMRLVDAARGWVRADATREELVGAVDAALPDQEREATAGLPALFAVGVLLIVFVALMLYLLWIAIV